MKKMIALFTLSFLLTGCIPASDYNITSKFDENEAVKSLKKGKNTINGSAFLRQNGGGVVTCAGYQATLIPATGYASERMAALYGSVENGYNPAHPFLRRNYNFIPDEKMYHELVGITYCDAQGKFSFKNVADGTFYITVPVVWTVEHPQGGMLMQKVHVRGGENREILITY